MAYPTFSKVRLISEVHFRLIFTITILTLFLLAGCTRIVIDSTPKTSHCADDSVFDEDSKQLLEHAIKYQQLKNEDVICAFAAVLRHRFVLPEYQDQA